MANPNLSPNRYYAKKDDNAHTIGAVLKYDSNGTPTTYDLTAATVLLLLVGRDTGTTHSITATPDPDQVTNKGKVTVSLTSTHLATADTYDLEWEATTGATKATFPSNGYDELIVGADKN